MSIPSAGAAPETTLYVIRHGETAWTLTGQHTGSTELPLTPAGEEQARQLAPWLAGVQFSQVLCSPRLRARQTCEQAGLGVFPTLEPDLAEWDYGGYEGRRSVEIRQENPNWNGFIDGYPGGETPAQIAARADRLITRLAGRGGNIALFSHGHMSAVLITSWIGLNVQEGEHFPLSTASLSILGTNPSHPEVRIVTLLNAVPARLGAGGAG